MVDVATREKTRMETDEAIQFRNVIEWARRNPTKEVNVYALDVDERDRLKALITSLCGEQAPPLNIIVDVRPEDMNTPINVRVG